MRNVGAELARSLLFRRFWLSRNSVFLKGRPPLLRFGRGCAASSCGRKPLGHAWAWRLGDPQAAHRAAQTAGFVPRRRLWFAPFEEPTGPRVGAVAVASGRAVSCTCRVVSGGPRTAACPGPGQQLPLPGRYFPERRADAGAPSGSRGPRTRSPGGRGAVRRRAGSPGPLPPPPHPHVRGCWWQSSQAAFLGSKEAESVPVGVRGFCRGRRRSRP